MFRGDGHIAKLSLNDNNGSFLRAKGTINTDLNQLETYTESVYGVTVKSKERLPSADSSIDQNGGLKAP